MENLPGLNRLTAQQILHQRLSNDEDESAIHHLVNLRALVPSPARVALSGPHAGDAA
jgi:hypothetical protein